MPALIENMQLACAICKIGVYSVFRKLCCNKAAPPRPEFNPVCIGLANAGKTTLLTLLAGESLEEIAPTTGFMIKASQFRTAILNIKEIGGGEKVRPFWKHYYGDADAVIYVVDAACSDSELQITKAALHDALTTPKLQGLPLLVLANCQDKSGARTANQLEKDLELDGLFSDRRYRVRECTKEDKEGLREVFEDFNKLLTHPEAESSEEDKANESPGQQPETTDINRV